MADVSKLIHDSATSMNKAEVEAMTRLMNPQLIADITKIKQELDALWIRLLNGEYN